MSVIWSGVTEQGAVVPVQVDETGKVVATAGASGDYVLRSGDTMTGDLTVPGIDVPDNGVINAFQTPIAFASFQTFSDGSVELLGKFNVRSVTWLGQAGKYTVLFEKTLDGYIIPSIHSAQGFNNRIGTFCWTISGNRDSWLIGSGAIESNGTVAAGGSLFYWCVWYSVPMPTRSDYGYSFSDTQ